LTVRTLAVDNALEKCKELNPDIVTPLKNGIEVMKNIIAFDNAAKVIISQRAWGKCSYQGSNRRRRRRFYRQAV